MSLALFASPVVVSLGSFSFRVLILGLFMFRAFGLFDVIYPLCGYFRQVVLFLSRVFVFHLIDARPGNSVFEIALIFCCLLYTSRLRGY